MAYCEVAYYRSLVYYSLNCFSIHRMLPLRKFYYSIRSGVVGCSRCMSSGSRLVDLTVDNDGIATVTMQRPPVNSLNLKLLQSLSGALDEVAKNKCKAMILTSSVPTVFSSGGDFVDFYKPEKQRFEALWTCFQDVWIKLFGSEFITAAAINGHSLGSGCVLPLSCEYRAMVNGNYTIGYTEPMHGSFAPKWFVYSMTNILPKKEAEYALITAKRYSVEEALKVGLIDTAATDKSDAIEKCRQFIAKFDKTPSIVRGITKKKFREGPLLWMSQNRKADLDQTFAVYNSPEVAKMLEVVVNKNK